MRLEALWKYLFQSSSELKLVLTSMSQINSSLQKRNEELTNQLLTLILHLKNEQLNQNNPINQDIEHDQSSPTNINKTSKRKSQLCILMWMSTWNISAKLFNCKRNSRKASVHPTICLFICLTFCLSVCNHDSLNI